MDTQAKKGISHEKLPQSLMLAKRARAEKLEQGCVTVVCPKCQEHPKITVSSGGERTIVSCKCRYVFDGEINF